MSSFSLRTLYFIFFFTGQRSSYCLNVQTLISVFDLPDFETIMPNMDERLRGDEFLMNEL